MKKTLIIIAGIAAGLTIVITPAADRASVAGDPPLPAAADRIRHPSPDSVSRNFSGYIWPTDASKKITSSFAEYRSAHFHGGIDISTNGTVGHRIFSVQDGYLYRVRITPNGYGKMLYVKHPDGYISTYAHLKSFNPAIEELARAEQRRTGTYEIDLIYETPLLRLKRGELIAYSGDTGFGPPHLHFEIRDGNLNPVNPLLGQPYRMVDNIPPTLYRFLVRPLDAGSTINDQDDPKIYSRLTRRDGTYRLGEKIRIRGRVGFGVETRDRSDGVGGRTGVHTLELLIDGESAFLSSMNAVPILKTKQIYIHYDLPMILGGKGRFQKLYIERGNELPFYDRTPVGGGVIDADELAEGDHQFVVRCTDIHGNSSTLTGTLVVSHPPEVALGPVNDRSVTLINRSGAPIAAVSVGGRRQSAAGWSDHTLPGARIAAAGDTLVVPVNTGAYDILKISARTAKGSWSDPLFVNRRKEGGPAHRLRVDHQVVGDELRITLTSAGVFTDRPTVLVSEGPGTAAVAMKARDVSSFVGYYPLPPRNAEPRTIRAGAEINGHPVEAEERLGIYSIPHDRAGELTSARDGFSVSYDSGAVFRPLHFTVSKETSDGATVYAFEPRDVLLNRGIRISLPVEPGEQRKPGIYFRGTQGWALLSSAPGTIPGTMSGTLSTTLGEVAILSDVTPPTIGLLRAGATRGIPTISYRYHDNLSGVDFDRCVVTIDDDVIVPEIDGEHRRVKYTGRERLKKGKHLVRILLRDRMGNESTAERWLTVR